MNKKGLIRSIAKSLKKNKKMKLTDEQKKMLGEILEDKDMLKYIEKLGKGFNKKDQSELLGLIKQVHEHGHTDVRKTEQGTGRGAADPEQPDRTPTGPDRTPTGPDRTPTGPDRTPTGPDRTPGGQTNEDVYARILTKNIFTANLSAREWLALQQIYAEEKKAAKERVDALSGIENPTPDQQKALEEAQDVLKKVTILERRAYNAARARAGAEAADPNNNISEEQRRSLQDFANRGRRSTEAKKVITEEDHRTAKEAREQLDKIVTERKNKPKSGGR